MRKRGFELISSLEGDNNDLLPKRSTKNAAGYDLKALHDVHIPVGHIALVATGVKAYMQPGEVLYLYDRSSNPKKKGVVLINSVGVIDADYYNNEDNEGHIFVQFKNISDKAVHIARGERVAQAVFAPFLLADDDDASGERVGGFGSTGR